ncbi:putative RNA binding protein [Tripterygium wilfordii]|uniref:Putative RNA binding protein n=1 Tax=Tripterygium wilfordii TaxID=458696 RepID=A0A7J7C7X4_TRIWF|nr:G patch domain-containing protein TGH [Tripterygium wilfordii]KAF5730239.1 putative RNA binding protein [Tripterygium wilfordii]
MDSDEEDFVFVGTPIEREEGNTSRKKKALAEVSGQLRTLPSWKQEVRDEEGRRRFHGAFTGGYSAGYYNTVGSKEGWTPQSFTSSRKNRAEVKQQSILNFLDEDERADLEGQLGTSSQFDTFGFTTAEYARKQAEKEQQSRPSAIPGPVPAEIVIPVTESVGEKLLLKMGWRRGRSIKDSHANSLYDVRREARKAFLALSSDDAKAHLAESELAEDDLESFMKHTVKDDVPASQSTPLFVLNPKQDLHGLGYDPFNHAPEFREKKRSRVSSNCEPGNKKALSIKESLFGLKSGKAASGFGIGALEEYDAEDEDIYAAEDLSDAYVQEPEEPSRSSTDDKQKLVWKEPGVLPGFRVASNSDYQQERFNPPVIPKDFVPRHVFLGPLVTDDKYAVPPPLEVNPPEDNSLKVLIDGVATLVARCGKLFEDICKEKNQSNPLFSFLSGGNGHDYYAMKLWEEQQKRSNQSKLALDGKSTPSVQKMTAESRGKILGERPLERSSRESSASVAPADTVNLQFNLSNTFTEAASFGELLEIAKPFKDDPAKQERFELFLKEKYKGGLRTIDSGGINNMSEAVRARERLDFEAAAEAIQKAKLGKESNLSSVQLMEFSAAGGMQFTSGGLEKIKDAEAEDLMAKKMYPKREEFQWRPSPILCKRFDLIDPYMGKPPPAPRMRSKMDSLIFTSDSLKAKNVEETIANRDQFPLAIYEAQEQSKEVTDQGIELEPVEAENVERPVDLYKAIFSDDSDDEVETSIVNKADPEKKIEAASNTLSRLIAGDFLESLGKELGLEVPPDPPYSANKDTTPGPHRELNNGNGGSANTVPSKLMSSSDRSAPGRTPGNKQELHDLKVSEELETQRSKHIDDNLPISNRKYVKNNLSEKRSGEVDMEMAVREDRRRKSPSSHHQDLVSCSSSEDDRSRKHSRRRQHRSRDTYTDSSSSDHRSQYQSSSKRREKGSSREKSRSSRKHSKHRRDGSRDSPSRSSHRDTGKGHAEGKRQKRRRRD